MNKFFTLTLFYFFTFLNGKAQFSIPYTEDFSTNVLNNVIGNNATWYSNRVGGNNWVYRNASTMEGYAATAALKNELDDSATLLLTTPALSLVAGKTYTFSFQSKLGSASTAKYHRLGVNTTRSKIGANWFYNKIMPLNGYSAPVYHQNNPTFTVPVTGTYYIIYQLYNLGGASRYLDSWIDNVVIEETVYPTVSITAPLNNTSSNENYLDSTRIFVDANAADADGAIDKVEFYLDGVLKQTAINAPYKDTFKDVNPGAHKIWTIAYDNRGNKTTSDTVNYFVNFRDGSYSPYVQWDFNSDNQNFPGSNFWRFNLGTLASKNNYRLRPSFHASQGLEIFEIHNDGQNFAASPSVGLKAGMPYNVEFVSNSGSTRIFKLYISKTPNFSDTVLIDTVKIINEDYKVIHTKTFTVPTDGTYHLLIYYPIPTGAYNVYLQTKIDQLRIIGSNLNIGPAATITRPSKNITIAENANMLLNCNAYDPDGILQKVEYYANNVKIGEATTSPFAFNWMGIVQGVYDLVAKPIDVTGNYGLSLPIKVTTTPNSFKASGMLGSSIGDTIRATLIKENNEIVLAGNFGSDFNPAGATKYYLNGATNDSLGAIVILSSDGKTVKSVTRVCRRLADMSKDQNDLLYIAAAESGVIKISPNADALIWKTAIPNITHRIDASKSGKTVVMASNSNVLDNKAMLGTSFYFLNTSGSIVINLPGVGQYGGDCALDDASETIVEVGFKNYDTYDSPTATSQLPVFVPIVKAYDFSGMLKYTAYDWSSDRNDPRWLNRSNNNMADARLNRCAIGKDGKLYIAGQIYGGNHIFRYQPFDNMAPAAVTGGDNFHNMSNTGTETHVYFGRFDVATGNVLLQKTVTSRLDNAIASGNSIFIDQGGIDADEDGNVYITGQSAYGMPTGVDYLPGEYTGGSYLIKFDNAFNRVMSVRLGAYGYGRSVFAKANGHVVYAGTSPDNIFYTTAPHWQNLNAGANDGFIGVINEEECTYPNNQNNIATSNYNQINLASKNIFTNTSCQPIAIVAPTNYSSTFFADSASVKLWIENVANNLFVKRHYEITPVDYNGAAITNANTKTAKVTLYFTQQEFDEYNALNTVKLPQSFNDASGISNLQVIKTPGMSRDGTGLPESYNGQETIINPNDYDIIFNVAQNRWEVSFDVNGFSGFFVNTISSPLSIDRRRNSVTNSNANYLDIAIWPNPTSSIININASAKQSVYLLNSAGANMQTINLNTGINIINLGKYAAGIYVLKTNTGQAYKLIKN